MSYERKTEDIFVSEDLKKILAKIEKQSPVAELLLKKRHDRETLADGHVNYISVSADDPSKISYLTKERQETMCEDEYWTSKRRYHAKPGALVAKVFKNITARDIEDFSTLFRNASSSEAFRFAVVRGGEIAKYYQYDTYASESGSLGASCMKYEKCQEYMYIYTLNQGSVSMLVMLDDRDRVLGRALLWDLGERKVMDRIYTIRDEKYRFHFVQWAEENGHLCKKSQNWFDTMNFQGGGKTHTLKLEVKLGRHRFEYYPYMDTFKFYNKDTGTLYNYLPESEPVRVLCSAEGDYMDDEYLVLDVVDNVYRYRNDAAYLRYINAWTSTDNAYYSEKNGCYILKSHGSFDLIEDDYVFTGEYAHLNNKKEQYARSEEEALPF